MTWREFTERYGEHPDEHFDDPAAYWDSRGDHHIANAIRARRRKIEDGDIAGDE